MRPLQLLLRDRLDCVQLCRSCVGSGDRVGSSLVVRHSSSSGGCLSNIPITRPPVLVQGWGLHLLDQFVSGRWSVVERSYSINLR